ncbi:MAG: hypothetical protein NT094_01090 [Candidatus Staskawiczbacteria bacterium]|nr:hypothetical protein [Candidatus Staskawiczbacteria bacterium]
MKINIKILAIILVIILILIEGYLITSYILDEANTNNELQNYCGAKCSYSPSSLMWEFSGETFTKGFTTKEECFNYCSKVKQGFAASLLEAILNLTKK